MKSKIILEIAKKYFDLDSLKSKGLDREDFVDIHISLLKDALEEAFDRGLNINYN